MGILTDREMQKKATGKDLWLTEDGPRGAGRFVGRITPSGERSFYFRHTTSSGDRDALRIGVYDPKGKDGLTLAESRGIAEGWRKLYQSGIKDLREHFAQQETDRLAAEALERARIESERLRIESEKERRKTVRQMFDQWRLTLKPMTRADGRRVGRKDGGKYVQEQFERHVFPHIGNLPIEDVRKADLLALLEKQTAMGKARTANVLLADLKQFFDYVAEHEVIPGNPIATLKKRRVGGADVARERHLSTEELAMLKDAVPLSGLNLRSQAGIWLILATGVRIGELAGAVWAKDLPTNPLQRAQRINELHEVAQANEVKLGLIDTKARTWHLLETKNQRDHTIHLSDFAILQIGKLAELREALKDDDGKALCPWLFPATNNHRPVCVKSLGKQLADRQREPEKRLKNRAKNTTALKLPGGKWTAHDLRRTTGTMMAHLGFPADTINECLNHVTTDRMTKVYIKSRREDDQARAFDAMGRYLSQLHDPKVSGEVLEFRR